MALWRLLETKASSAGKVTLEVWEGVFETLDENGSGALCRRELFKWTESNHLFDVAKKLSKRQGCDLSRETWKAMFERLDADGDGQLTLQELRRIEDDGIFEELQRSIFGERRLTAGSVGVLEAAGAAGCTDFERLAVILRKTLKLVEGLAAASAEEQITGLQLTLKGCDRASKLVQELLGARLQAEAKVARSGYLQALSEIIPRPGPEAMARWRDEWEPLLLHNQAILNSREEVTAEERAEVKMMQLVPLENCLIQYGARVKESQRLGADEDDAAALLMAPLCQKPMVRALRAGDTRYAVPTHRLADAVARLARFQLRRGDKRPVLYANLCAENGLTTIDEAWHQIDKTDATGFRGVLSMAAVTARMEQYCLDEGGFYRWAPWGCPEPLRSPIVAFEPQPQHVDGSGDGHNAAMVRHYEGIFPPNTLFKVKSVSDKEEFTTPAGLTVKQRLITVTATYRLPASQDSMAGDAKICAPPTTLSYEGREAFVRGLDKVTEKPVLTIYQEFDRDFSWTDWKGVGYNLRDEMAYVRGKAVVKEDCTPGIRDMTNEGMTLADFVHRANSFVKQRRADGYTGGLPEKYADLTEEEVLGIRLYSGPAYQPINDFLRQLGRLTGAFREHVATNPSLTFAATVGHIMRAIRKLAAVVTPEEAKRPLWRGVRGILPHSFWLPDATGMVCATDLALMSTSRNAETPIKYMGQGDNVLWELEPSMQTDAGFHHGADIAMLSQFAAEDEVLFPPYTMLRVKGRLPSRWSKVQDWLKSIGASGEDSSSRILEALAQLRRAGPGTPEAEAAAEAGWQVQAGKADGGNKKYIKITVIPQFA